MKKQVSKLLVLLLGAFIIVSAPSCKAKYGCPINEEAHNEPDKKGKYKKSKTRSGLFPKGVY